MYWVFFLDLWSLLASWGIFTYWISRIWLFQQCREYFLQLCRSVTTRCQSNSRWHHTESLCPCFLNGWKAYYWLTVLVTAGLLGDFPVWFCRAFEAYSGRNSQYVQGNTGAAVDFIDQFHQNWSNLSQQKELRPTPSRSHYTFNLRDIAKVRWPIRLWVNLYMDNCVYKYFSLVHLDPSLTCTQ